MCIDQHKIIALPECKNKFSFLKPKSSKKYFKVWKKRHIDPAFLSMHPILLFLNTITCMDCLLGSCFTTFLNRDNINMIDNNFHVPFHMGTKILILCVFDSDPHHCSRAPCRAQSLEYVDRAHWDPAVPSASSASSSSPSHMSRSCTQTTETSWSRYMSLECHLTKQKRKKKWEDENYP